MKEQEKCPRTNREKLIIRIKTFEAMSEHRREQVKFVWFLEYLKSDRFKIINDSLKRL